MILRQMFEDDDDYICEITKFLDENIKSVYFKNSKTYKRGITYIYDPIWSIDRGFSGKDDPSVILGVNKHPVPKDYAYLPIRRPGRTIGSIKVNKSFNIEEVIIYDDVLSEFKITNKDLEKYIGRRIKIVSTTELLFRAGDKNSHYVSELTEDMDKCLIEDYPRDIFEHGYTYLDYIKFDTPNRPGEMVYAIRTPGATRANLIVDSNTLKVKDIIFIEETCKDEYTKEVKEICNKYIGRKIKIIGGK